MSDDTWGYFKKEVERQLIEQGCENVDSVEIDYIDISGGRIGVGYDKNDNDMMVD